MLEKLGYNVYVANNAINAIEILRENKEEIDLIILDLIMPDVGGGETFDRIKEIDVNLKVLLSSGYNINGHATEIINRGCDGFIQKPYNIHELSGKIQKILAMDPKGWTT